MPALATTSFSTQPDKEMLVKDAYGKKDNAIENKDSPSGDQAFSSPASPEEVTPVKTEDKLSTEKAAQASEPAPMVQENAKELAKGLDTPMQTALNTLPKSLKDTVLGAVEGAQSAINAAAGEVNKVLQNVSAAEVKGVANAINSLTKGNLSVRDLNSLASLGTNLVSQADLLGMPGAYESFVASSTDPSVLRTMTEQLLPMATDRGSLPLLSSLSKGPLQNDLKAMVPGVVGSFIENYTAPATLSQNELLAQGREMLDTFDRIDPQWQDYSTTAGGVRARTDAFANASSSTQRAMNALSRQVVNGIKNKDPVALVDAVPVLSPQVKTAVRAVASMTQSKKLAQTRQRSQGAYGTTRSAKTAVNARISLGQDFPQIGVSVTF